MSEFDDFMAEGLDETLETLGTTAFTCFGQTYRGDLAEAVGGPYSLVIGGREVEIRQNLLCAIGQFGGVIPAEGTRLRIGDRAFMIAAVNRDATSVTFGLAHPDKS